MIKLKQSLIAMAAVPITLVLLTSGCATKNYVRSQVNPVNQKLGQFEKKTNDQISYINTKQQRDMSAVNERFDTTDQKLAEVASTVQQAQERPRGRWRRRIPTAPRSPPLLPPWTNSERASPMP